MRRVVSGLLGVACWLVYSAPALAAAAATEAQPKEDVTLAMFILIFALIVLLTLAVVLENRKGAGH